MAEAAGVEFAKVSYTLAAEATGKPGRTLLHDISLRLDPGTTTALLGRSGSGKTTLLRMVNGLVLPSSGSVRVGGVTVPRYVTGAAVDALRRNIGYCIQETGLFPHMTVERNAAMALELAGVSAAERSRRAVEVLQQVGIDAGSFGSRYPWQLSGGQRQRVGLARALAADPHVLLMDEPFGALDPMTRAEMQTMLRDLLRSVRKTVLLVTHDLDEALYLAQRVIFLESGKVIADLPSGKVLGSANEAVQAYVHAVHRAELPEAAAQEGLPR